MRKRDKQLNVRMDEDFYAQVARTAEANGVSISELTIKALSEKLGIPTEFSVIAASSELEERITALEGALGKLTTGSAV